MEGSGHLPGYLAHEYVLSRQDSQQELLEAVCERFRAGEGVSCRFFEWIPVRLKTGVEYEEVLNDV